MAKYSYITDKSHNNRKIQVESAKRDGSGKNFENNYAKQNGNYQSLTAGLSNNFDTKKVMADESAYNFRPTATMGSVELEVGSPCKVKKIVGGSVAYNQLVENGNFASASNWTITGATYSVSNNEAVITMSGSTMNFYQAVAKTSGHKYIIHYKVKASTDINEFTLNWGDKVDSVNITTSYVERYKILTNIGGNNNINFNIYQMGSQGDIIYLSNVYLIDLTQMFGSTIADYIYSLEQANAGSGVAWFKRYFPKEYYAYNSGELVSVKTQGKKITHFNQWDEEWEQGFFDDNLNNVSSNNNIRSKNFINVLPNTTYYFRSSSNSHTYRAYFCDIDGNILSIGSEYFNRTITTPSGCYKIKFFCYTTYGGTYNHDICINFHYDGERDGEYEPYDSETYACDDDELRGIPQLDENNNLAFDGDEYFNDGNVTSKYGIVDLSQTSFTWDGTRFYSGAISSLAKLPTSNDNKANALCSTYYLDYVNHAYANPTIPSISIATNGNIYIYGLSSTDTTSGYLIYELATPTDETATPFTEVQECDNWGTEEWLAPTTDTRPCEVPVGHETDYLPDLKAKLEVAPNTPNENGVYVMEHNESGNSYTPIATWLADNGYAKADTLPTKDSVGGTLRQLLAVKETLDFDNTAYVDLGSLTWTYLGNNAFSATNVGVKSFANDAVLKALSTKYKVVSYNTLNGDATKVCMCGYVGDDSRIYIRDTAYTDATAFKNAMKGVLLAYEKAS